MHSGTYLFITDGRLALCLLVVVGKLLKLLNRIGLNDFGAELDVAFCIFMAGLSNISILPRSEYFARMNYT